MCVKKVWASILVLSSAIYFPAMAAQTMVKSAEQPVAVYSEEKQNILVAGDQPEFTIQLKSNPTTGFSWFLREYDTNILIPVKHVFQKSDSKLMGAPGYEVWTFRVKPNGFIVPQQTTIRFIYARPWQGADNSTQLVFRVTTTVKK